MVIQRTLDLYTDFNGPLLLLVIYLPEPCWRRPTGPRRFDIPGSPFDLTTPSRQ